MPYSDLLNCLMTEQPVNDLFILRLDMSTWEVTEKKVLNQTIKAEKMIEEFVVDIDQLKEKLLSHYKEPRNMGKRIISITFQIVR